MGVLYSGPAWWLISTINAHVCQGKVVRPGAGCKDLAAQTQ